MSRRLTSVRLRDSSGRDMSIADNGRKTRREMIDSIRKYAADQIRMAQRILDADDKDFIVETYTGVHYNRNIEEVPPEPARAALADAGKEGA